MRYDTSVRPECPSVGSSNRDLTVKSRLNSQGLTLSLLGVTRNSQGLNSQGLNSQGLTLSLLGVTRALLALKRIDDAISRFERVLELQPGHQGGLRRICRLCEGLKMFLGR